MTFFGTNLRYLRKQSRLSQHTLAEKIGMNRGNIASYEKGTAEPNFSNLLKIGNFFSVELGDLIERDFSTSVQPHDSTTLEPETGAHESMATIHASAAGVTDLSQFAKRSEEIRKILEGFREYHKLRTTTYQMQDQLPKRVQELMIDYDRLLDLAQSIHAMNEQLLHALTPSTLDVLDREKEKGA